MSRKTNWKLRQILASKLQRNGGYRRGRGEDFVLEWCVPVYASLTRSNLVPAIISTGEVLHEADLRLQYPEIEDVWEQYIRDPKQDERTWEWLIEDMRESVTGSDCYAMWRPEIAKKWGFSYDGLGADKPFEVEFCFAGRGGKHLCIEKFEGISLNQRDLIDNLLDPEEAWPTLWVRQLLGMIEEWDLCFTQEA
ncbi:MAG TPA: hypothetical protein VF077_10290, partial [Nitrospiraceae bacterium]